MAQPKNETPTIQDTKNKRTPLLYVLAVGVTILLFLIGWFLLSQFSSSQDTNASKEYDKIISTETDCAKIMRSLGDTKGTTPVTNAKILGVKITCSRELGNYDQSLAYIAELEKIYTDNPSLYRYTDINASRQQVAEQKANANEKGSVNVQDKTKKSGFQPDGSYYGP